MSSNRVSATVNEEVIMTQTANGKKASGNDGGKKPPSLNGENRPSSIGSNGSAPPSPDGSNGSSAPGRGADGRFTMENIGGPGNPYARRVAALRQAALEGITPDDMRSIMTKLAALAKDGDVAAAKIVLSYAIGKPAEAPNPDRLDVEEWKGFKETAPMLTEASGLMTPHASLPVEMVRYARDARTHTCADMIRTTLLAPEQDLPALFGQWKRAGAKRNPGRRPADAKADWQPVP
jgi:hypothetical protein